MRGNWRPNRNCNILTPHSYGRQRCVFLVLQMLNREAQGPLLLGAGFLLLHLISIFSGPQLIRAPSPFSPECGFPYPHLIYNSSSNCNCNSDFSGNNCHAVHRSLSFGSSVYECIMGFTLSHFISQINPRDLFRLLAIAMCHFLPVHLFVMACLLEPKVKIQHHHLHIYINRKRDQGRKSGLKRSP